MKLYRLGLVLGLLLLAGCTPRPVEKTPVRVLIASSMMIPFDALEKAYEAEHPEIDLQVEAHGSIQVIRHVTEIHEPTDVVVTADAALIPMLMYATTIPDTEEPYASWYVKFATNRLGLAYRPDSKYADELSAENWYQVIARPDVQIGLADPRFDASGYRALMVLQLAEAAYGKPLIFENMIMDRFKTSITVRQEGNRWVIYIPEIVEAKPDSGIVVRGSSVALIALLESGDLDYAFEYESVIQQHGFQLLSLPDAVNLGEKADAANYATVDVQMDFQRFLSIKPVFRGAVIGYGVTVPTNAPQPKAAVDFVTYLLGPEGQRIFTENYQPLITPPQADGVEQLPAALQSLCVPLTP
jgi:molybdate/tungstate transport system substrate-binding protein